MLVIDSTPLLTVRLKIKVPLACRPVVSVYVGKGLNTTVNDIDDGGYELFYTAGTDWDDQLKTFTRSCLFKRFQMSISFTTTPSEGGVRSTTQVISLRDQVGGNARTTVTGQSFPR